MATGAGQLTSIVIEPRRENAMRPHEQVSRTAGAPGAGAPAGGAAAQRFGEAARRCVAVEVPVQVVRDGEPVRGLTAADFEVFEGPQEAAVTGFEVVDLAGPRRPGKRATPVTRWPRGATSCCSSTWRSPSPSRSCGRATRPPGGRPALHPTDLVAVATYSARPGRSWCSASPPTAGRSTTALDTLGLPGLLERTPDPLRLVVKEVSAEAAAGTTTAARRGQCGRRDPRGPGVHGAQQRTGPRRAHRPASRPSPARWPTSPG